MTFTITCYGEKKTYPDSARKQMMDFYAEGMIACEGSERDRYTSVYMGLRAGAKNVDDDWQWETPVPKKTVPKTKRTVRKAAKTKTAEYGTIRPQTVKKRAKTNQMGLNFYLDRK